MKDALSRTFYQARKNPRTSIIGVVKSVGALWWLWMNRGAITPEHLMNMNTLGPLAVLVSAVGDFFTADAQPGGQS